jgi:hypothetical protein
MLNGKWREERTPVMLRQSSLEYDELIPDMHSVSMDWETFCDSLWNEDMVWLTPEAYVITPRKEDDYLARGFPWSVYLIITPIREEKQVDYDSLSLTVHARELTAAASACEFLLCLLTRSQQHNIYIGNGYCPDGKYRPSFPIAGPTLSNFFQEIHHRKVTLAGFTLNEDQCHALATVSSPDLEINLERCTLQEVPGDTGCQDACIECLQRNRGPTTLDRCLISNRILTSALTGNTRVVKLRICGKPVPDNAGMSTLFQSLPKMRGLVELNLHNHYIIDDNWHILCESLKTHRTLTSLDLRCAQPWNAAPITNEEKLQRTCAIAEMLEVNTVLHTINLYPFTIDESIYTEFVTPSLETNRYRPRVLAIKQADDRSRRALLGRALQSELVRNKANLLWMFLSENADTAIESIEG